MLPAERERLQADWAQLLHTYAANATAVREAFDAIVACYAAADRHYHTIDHVRSVLDVVRHIGRPAQNPMALELAAWFHDAVYDAHAGDNEVRSAEYAHELLRPLGVPRALLEEAARLILLTKTHQTAADDTDGKTLLDADLSVLGADDAEYDRYAAAIRREYAWVAEEDYRAGRRRVLEGFLLRPRIYQMDAQFGRLEEQARRNLRREIANLGA